MSGIATKRLKMKLGRKGRKEVRNRYKNKK
jgi:hypothetical protein